MHKLEIWTAATAMLLVAAAGRAWAQVGSPENHQITASELLEQFEGWIGHHRGVGYVLGASVVVAIITLVYNRYTSR